MDWIAKPLNRLNEKEKNLYAQLIKNFSNTNIPLSQTLSWGIAIVASGGEVLVIFKEDLSCGGIAFSTRVGEWECVNGPLINWHVKNENENEKKKLIANISTFILAISKVASNFRSFYFRPRLEEDWGINIEKVIPFPIDNYEYTATTFIPSEWSIMNLRSSLRRSVRRMQQEDHKINIVKIGEHIEDYRCNLIEDFYPKLYTHALKKNFYLPSIEWFKGLLREREEAVEFYLGTIEHKDKSSYAEAGILVVKIHQIAYYLFGYSWREGMAIRNLNFTSLLHLKMIESLNSQSNKIKFYDLNGYVCDPKIITKSQYAGVNFFKEGLNGKIKKYITPCYRFITNL
ncbi:MAG: hypothetical protein HQK49_19235 [Oligoflexia bacterium]|nr:hypothetical protein [Oligoflexia bacterium]